MAPNHSWWGGWGKHASPTVSASEIRALQQKIAQLEKASKGQAGLGPAQGQGKVKGKWWCLLKDCEKSAKGALNNATRTTCFCCGQQKGYCMSPPVHLCRTDAQDQVAAKKQAEVDAKAEGAAPKAAAKPAAKPAAKAETASAAKAAKTGHTAAAPLSSVPVAPSVTDYDKARVAPPETVVVQTVEEVLLGVAPKDRAFGLAQARDDVTHWTAQLESAKKGSAGSARLKQVPELQVELDKAAALVETLAAKAPVTACTVTFLQKSLSDYEHITTTRVEAWKKGAAKAAAAEEAVTKLVQDHIVEWQAYLKSITDDATARRTAWQEHHDAVVTTMKKVAATLKERHAAAVLADPGAAEAAASAAAEAASASTAASVTSSDDMEEITLDPDHYLSVLYAPTEIPDHKVALESTSDTAKSLMSKMWGNVHSWPMHSGTQMTFHQFGGAEGVGFTSLKALLGPVIWSRTYADRADAITPQDIMPRQMATPLLLALSLASCHLGEQESLQKVVAQCNQRMEEMGVESVSKKRRAA